MARTTADPFINLSQLPMPVTALDFAATNDALLDAYRSSMKFGEDDGSCPSPPSSE